MVEYAYDSWGKLLSCTGTLATSLGSLNPFRYRGYVYDQETGFYYLKSRYYDPVTCRFISADVLLSTGQGVLGHNCYAYCLNDPINRSDNSGHSSRIADFINSGGGEPGWSTGNSGPSLVTEPGVVSVGLYIEGEAGAAGLVSISYAKERNSPNWEVQLSGGLGGGTLAASGGISITVCNAPSLEAFDNSTLLSSGGSISFLGVDWIVLMDSNGGTYSGISINISVLPFRSIVPFEWHALVSKSKTLFGKFIEADKYE